VTLTIMDTLSRNLNNQGLELEGMAAGLAERTRPTEDGRPSFSPPR
jgi:hypothetical protein